MVVYILNVAIVLSTEPRFSPRFTFPAQTRGNFGSASFRHLASVETMAKSIGDIARHWLVGLLEVLRNETRFDVVTGAKGRAIVLAVAFVDDGLCAEITESVGNIVKA